MLISKLKSYKAFQVIVLCSLATVGVQAESLSAEDWYRDSYGPLWKENAWDKADEIAAHYAESINSHRADGTIESVNSREWMTASLKEWQADGWLGSEITTLRRDRINPSTVAIKAKWRDWYKEADDEFSCGWYLLDATDDGWAISQYADLDCAEHKL